MIDGPRQGSRLANLDLNLLVTLRALFRERNVTRAARHLGVTQPAVSASLSRLRRHFGDELLVRVQGVYVLTPLATQLSGQVETVCAAAERLFATGSAFEPGASQRAFTLLMADYPATVLGPGLSRLFAEEAPQASLHLQLVRETLGRDADGLIRLVDGVVSPPLGHFRNPGVASRPLFRDRWVCLVAEGHPLAEAGSFSVADLARQPWVVPYHRDNGYLSAAPASRQLSALGIRPHIAVRVESYRAVPDFVAGTRRVALVPDRLVAALPRTEGLLRLDCPVSLDPLEEHLWWDASHDEDPAHCWLRDLVMRASVGICP
ncbi:LysR family transcriptional regulator [Stenotrophomonas sp. NPDC087984]